MKKKRPWIILVVAMLTAGVLVWKKAQIQHAVLSFAIMHEQAPGQTAMHEMVEDAADPVAALQELWDTGRLVQRRFVGNYVRERYSLGRDGLWPQTRMLAIRAASGCDTESQKAALGVLSGREDPLCIPVALAMLGDVDPAVRTDGLLCLEELHDPRMVPVFVRMLKDEDRSVRAYAAGGLAGATGQDSHVKFGDADRSDSAGLEFWRSWWDANKAKYHDVFLPPASKKYEMPLGEAPEFTLPDLDGKTVRLSDLRGRPVLLVFWAASSPTCRLEVADLSELQRRRGSEFSLLAIEADDSQAAGEGLHDVQQFVADQKIPYRVAIDRSDNAIAYYSDAEFPVAVWIDKLGIIRRRFLGLRNERVLEQMLDWIKQNVAG